MKTHLKFLAGVSALAAIASATAQDNTTKPVGFRTETIKGGGVFNLVSNELTEPVSAAGTLSAVGANSATDENADFTTSLAGENKTWVLQVTSGAASGTITEVTVTDATNVGTGDDLAAAGVAAGDSYEIRAAKTLSDIFGADNSAGLQAGSAVGNSDVIWIPDGQGGFVRYFFKQGGLGANGWTQVGGSAGQAGNAAVVFADAFFIQRRAAEDLDIVLVGHVPTQGINLALIPGFNFVSRVAVVGQTINTSGLADSLQKGPAVGSADVIWNPDGAGGYTRYFIKEGGLGANGPTQVGGAAGQAGDAALASGIIIQRRGAAANAALALPDFFAQL